MLTENKTIEKLNKKSSTLRIIGLLSILISFVTFVIYTRHQRNTIVSQVTLIKQKDSVLTGDKDPTIGSKMKKDSIINLVSSFFKEKKDSITCRMFFADTVANYYGHKNLSVEDIIRNKNYLYKKYPRVKADFSNSDISTSVQKDTLIAYVDMKDYVDSLKPNAFYKRTFKVKFGKNGKVFYVTAYREEDSPEKSKQ